MTRGALPPRRPKPEPANRVESYWGPDALWRRLAEIAADNELSKSALAVGVLTDWVRAYEKRKKKR